MHSKGWRYLITALAVASATFASPTPCITIEEYSGLVGTVDSERQRILTVNNFGANYCFNTELTEAFLDFCRDALQPLSVLEVGAAYGLKSAQIVQTGAYLTANEIAPYHIEVMANAFHHLEKKNHYFSHIAFIEGSFLEIEKDTFGVGSFDGILIESVLHFFTPEEIQKALGNVYSLLRPGGKVFILVSSPFLRYLYDAYLDNKAAGSLWPGFFSDPEEVHEKNKRLHKPYHLLDEETLSREVIYAGLNVIESRYTPLPHREYDMSLDGREGLLMIAEKPCIEVR